MTTTKRRTTKRTRREPTYTGIIILRSGGVDTFRERKGGWRRTAERIIEKVDALPNGEAAKLLINEDGCGVQEYGLEELREEVAPRPKNTVGRYTIGCRVSGGATGTRESRLEANGLLVRFEHREEAQAKVDELLREMGRYSTARFEYWVEDNVR